MYHEQGNTAHCFPYHTKARANRDKFEVLIKEVLKTKQKKTALACGTVIRAGPLTEKIKSFETSLSSLCSDDILRRHTKEFQNESKLQANYLIFIALSLRKV